MGDEGNWQQMKLLQAIEKVLKVLCGRSLKNEENLLLWLRAVHKERHLFMVIVNYPEVFF